MSDPCWSRHCGDLWREHVLAATGRDIEAVIGALPRRPAEWAATMRRLGVRTMSGVIRTVHGCDIDPRRARRGDIVRKGWAIGICRGELAIFFGGAAVPLAEVDEAWAIDG